MNGSGDLVIVGAGPVGLTAALAAARAGLSVTVLEAAQRPSTQWRASTFHAPTLEMCAELGVVDQMLELGLRAPTYQIRDRVRGIIAEFDMAVLAGDTAYPFRLQLEQYKYVDILLEALRSLPNVQIAFDRPVGDVHNTADETAVEYTVNGTIARAPWLLGADGARSTVRKDAGIGFEGHTYQHRYLLLSIDGPVERVFPDIAFVNYVADPTEHAMLLRIPDLWRIMFEVPADVADGDAIADPYVHAALHRLDARLVRMPNPSRQLYKVHQRVATTFRSLRILLAGDAAHINSPLGGMGLNSGIHDAVDLANVLAVGGSDEALEQWSVRRQRVAHEEIQRITHENTRTLSAVREAQAARDHDTLAEIAADPVRSREYLLESSMISNVRRNSFARSWA